MPFHWALTWNDMKHATGHVIKKKKHSLGMVELSEQALYCVLFTRLITISLIWCLCYVSVYVRPQCRKWDLALIFAQTAGIDQLFCTFLGAQSTAGLMEHIAPWWVGQRCSWQSLQASTWVCICVHMLLPIDGMPSARATRHMATCMAHNSCPSQCHDGTVNGRSCGPANGQTSRVGGLTALEQRYVR